MMPFRGPYRLLLYTLFSVVISIRPSTEEIQVHLQMREETPPFTRIGSIGSSLPEGLGSKLHYLTDSNFFSVTPSAGEVRVTRLVDRERLCPEHKLCCGVLVCQLEARIFVTNRLTGEFAASVTVKVDIQDQNDNRPMFATSSQKVAISEATSVGTYIALSPALDADVEPINQIQRYALVEPTGTFTLDVSELPTVRLQVMKPLDRERVEFYTATLEACDPGACARQSLEIQVMDENDNKPVFEKLNFAKRLMENTKVGDVVLRLNATDADSGERGRVLYHLHGSIDPDLLETFELVQETGEIRLRRGLSANIRDNYRFKVIACDAVSPSCSGDENSTVDITLMVEDVNNFAPSIHTVAAGVAVVTDDLSKSENLLEPGTSDGLSILENTPPSQVAVITVRDADLGENARVNCELNDSAGSHGSVPNFILTPSAPGIYSLRTSRMFDHEVEPTIRTKVVCHDFGSPERLTAARMITVKVSDVNEFQPEFSRRVYAGRVPENAPAGMEILKTTAIDRDRGALLRYSLAPSTMQQVVWNRANTELVNMDAVDVNKHFVIEPETGILRTSQIPLDRETMASVTLVVIVTDAKLPPIFTASTTVSIDILDENDNTPVFVNPPVDSVSSASSSQDRLATRPFTVMENSPRFTRLSEQLEARDPDQGDNGRLVFSLLSTYALTRSNRVGHLPFHRSDITGERGSTEDEIDAELLAELGSSKKVIDHPLFRITPDGGIETLVELDRETVPTYVLKIGVQDRGVQPLSSTTLLRVDVLDANDNAPVWIFPTPADRTINLTTAMKPGNLAGRLRAEDADAADAGRVEYMFLGPRGEVLKGLSLEEGLFKSLSEEKETEGTSRNVENIIVPDVSSGSLTDRGYRVGPFYLNGTTGEIWIAQSLTPGTVSLHLRAKDRGSPPSQTDAWLTINVFVDPSEELGFFNFGGDGTLNITIILVMITITAIVSLFLIVGIVCVRRRPSRYVAGREIGGTDGGVSSNGVASPYSVETNKEALTIPPGPWSAPAGMYAAGQYYPNQGQLMGRISDDGQYFTPIGSPGMMGYGAMMTPPDGHSIIYVPRASHQASGGMGSLSGGPTTPVPMDHGLVSLDYAGPRHLQTFGTMGRHCASVAGSSYGMPTNCGTTFEPHVDADSGDSGRGPSEEGNQFLAGENYRAGLNSNGSAACYSYHTYAGYRPSGRVHYRNGPYVEDMMNMHAINCTHNGTEADCGCYTFAEQQQQEQQQQQQPLYPVRFVSQSCDLGDYNLMGYSPPNADSAINQFFVAGVPPPPPPRSPVTRSSFAHPRDVHERETMMIKETQTANRFENSLPNPTDSAVGLSDTVRDQTSEVVSTVENGLQQTDSQINGGNTPLRIDLRKSNIPEDNELNVLQPDHPELTKRPTNQYSYTRQGPILPPLATKKTSVACNQSLGEKTS